MGLVRLLDENFFFRHKNSTQLQTKNMNKLEQTRTYYTLFYKHSPSVKKGYLDKISYCVGYCPWQLYVYIILNSIFIEEICYLTNSLKQNKYLIKATLQRPLTLSKF